MKWIFFIIALLAICTSSSCEANVKKLERRVKKLEQEKGKGNTEVKEKENENMSKLINELVGKKCILNLDENALDSIAGLLDNNLECEVIDVDEEWVKVVSEKKQKKENVKITSLIRIDNINGVKMVD